MQNLPCQTNKGGKKYILTSIEQKQRIRLPKHNQLEKNTGRDFRRSVKRKLKTANIVAKQDNKETCCQKKDNTELELEGRE